MTITGPAPGDLLRTALVVKAGGSTLSPTWQDQLLEVRVQLGLRSIGRATLTFADPGYALVSASVLRIGTDVTIASADGSTLLAGRVTAVSSQVTGRAGAEAVVTVQDAAYELTRHVAVETFQDSSFATIVGKLLRAGAVSTGTVTLAGEDRRYTMRNDSPLGLIDEIAARTGSDWVVHDGKFSLWPAATGIAPGAAVVPLRVEFELDEFVVREVGDGGTSVTVRGWDPQQQAAVEASAQTPRTRAAFHADASSRTTYSVLDARAATTSQADAQVAADAIAARTGRVTARGRCSFAPTLRPGGIAAISGAGPGNGEYYVREVTHVYDGRGTRSAFVAGDRDPVQLSDPWAARTPTSSFRRSGLVVGIVDKIDDPDNAGLVSVQLAVVGDSVSSAWARVLGIGAGADRGQVVMPEVGDEVLVGFEDDDVARPVVLGGLYGAKSKAPAVQTQDGKVVSRVITSRLGHVLEFSDGETDDAQHLRLELATAGHLLRIGKDRTDLRVPSGVPLAITAGSSSIAFDEDGGLTITAPTITLKADEKVAVDATEIAVKARTKLDLEGAQAQLKATGSGSVEAGGPLALKGAVVNIN